MSEALYGSLLFNLKFEHSYFFLLLLLFLKLCKMVGTQKFFSYDCKSSAVISKGPTLYKVLDIPLWALWDLEPLRGSCRKSLNIGSKKLLVKFYVIVLIVHLSKFTRVFGMYDVLKASHGVGRTQPYATQVDDYG